MLTGVHLSGYMYFGLDEILEHQLKEECRADTKDINGRTALSYAPQEGHQAVMKVLLRRNDIDINSKDCTDRTPLSIATLSRQASRVMILTRIGRTGKEGRLFHMLLTLGVSWSFSLST
jgi:ankyrin repeat protein